MAATEPVAGRAAGRSMGPLAVVVGVLGALAVFGGLLVPVVTMLLLAPRGFPTALSDGLGLTLYGVAGVVTALVVLALRRRPTAAATAAALLTIVMLFFQNGTWYRAGWLPAPPILPNVPAALVVVTGVVLATAVVARAGTRSTAPTGPAAASSGRALPIGIVAAAAVIVAVESNVWGRQRLQETFTGPFGLSLFQWLGVVFVVTLLASFLLGWLASSRPLSPVGPLTAAILVAVVVAVLWFATGLEGPPRTVTYGLALGLTVAMAVLGAGTARRRGSTL